MTTTLPATTPCAHHSAFTAAYATDSLYDFLTDEDAKLMEIIAFTIQWPFLSETSRLKSRPGSKQWLKLVFNAVQSLRPYASLDAKLKMAAETAIELRPAMTSKEWFEFLCEEEKPFKPFTRVY